MLSTGTDRYEYDPAGNLTAHTNGNSQTTTYRYDHNRLTEINYPDNPANNVYYTYGDSTAMDNAAGRIVLQEDASGWQTFKYGALGEVVENVRTFALPFEEQSYTFKMEYKYDSYNRIQSITYPDGEVVSHGYDLGGMLRKVEGEKGNEHFVYVKDIDYNEFGLKENVLYGNGCQSHYSYDILQRLSRLRTLNSAGEIMQRLRYTYDKVSNITEIDNSANTLINGLGGAYRNNYSYDNLYRLTEADGIWNGTQPCSYRLSMGYTPNGRINNKNLTATTWLDGVSSTENHSNRYNYTTAQPNTLTQISGDAGMQDFEWDANGNMVFHHNDGIFDRHLCWDEENRLQGVADQNHTSYYQYDANGERTYKLTGAWQRQQVNGRWYDYCVLDNPTLYTSPYLVATPKGYTKHYYAESERIASKVGGGGLFNVQCTMYNVQLSVGNRRLDEKFRDNKEQFHRVMGCLGRNVDVEDNILKLLREYTDIIADETECYWYHSDHLGSSSWITYTDGAAVQHLHYLPWGEGFVDQRSTSFTSRYTFSAKEKDTETGYSYFGARYYSSDLSIWLSVDPMAGKYPSLSPYVYCANNPIKLVDPNGREIGNYYDVNGEFLGNDGIDDNNTYIVRDAQGININNGKITVVNKDAIVQLPNANLRKSIVENLIVHDQTFPNAEWGGISGKPWNQSEYKWGDPIVYMGEKGKDGDPCEPGKVSYTQIRKDNFSVMFDFHSHPSGVCPSNDEPWGQIPSQKDINNVAQRQTTNRVFAVFGMYNKEVYLYYTKGIYATFSFEQFKSFK